MKNYLAQAGSSKEDKVAAIDLLGACEQYMIASFKVTNPSAKFETMSFKFLYNERLEEILKPIEIALSACKEVRESIRLRKVMALVLRIGNHINTGGSGKLAKGFTLAALLKLQEAKAFDKKTTVLQYLIKIIKKNDVELTTFKDDIKSVQDAERIQMDGLMGDLNNLNKELQKAKKTALDDAREVNKRLEGDNKLPEDAPEDKFLVKTKIGEFTMKASQKMKEALDKSKNVQSELVKSLRYFGEDVKMPSNEFFGTLTSFIIEFDRALEFVNKQEAKALKEKKLAEKQKKKEEEKKKKEEEKKRREEQKKKEDEEKRAKEQSQKEQANKENSTSNIPEQKGSTVLSGVKSVNAPTSIQMDRFSDGPPISECVRGISTLANTKNHDNKKLDESKDNFPAGDGIAAAAAAAALSKSKNSDVSDGISSPAGGIAAAAAAAALKKSKKKDSDASKEMPLPAGGIAAAAAAAAALKKSKKKDADASKEMPLPAGGIAAAAAAAALKKSKKKDSEASKEMPLPAGGIAAAAAAAALKKSKKKDSKKHSLNNFLPSVAAASNAREKVGEKSQNSQDSPSEEIATSAAASARSKQRRNSHRSSPDSIQKSFSDTEKVPIGVGTPIRNSKNTAKGFILKEDPEYAKYFKMLEVGLSKSAVMQVMLRDNKNPGIIDLDPSRPLSVQEAPIFSPVTLNRQMSKRNSFLGAV